MKILVTGSSGYIGHHLCEMIKGLYPNYQIDGLDVKPSVHTNLLKDIRCVDKLDTYDWVIHLAALAKVGESVYDPWSYYDININGTKNIIDNCNNIIFASSGSVEGLNSPYSLSKKACEDVIANICKKYTIFRFYNVIGESSATQKNEDSILFSLKRAAKNGEFYINGRDYDTKDGTAIRDYIHVEDVCRSILLAIFRPSNSIEGLGSGIGYSVLDVVKTFQRVNSVDFDIKYKERRPGDMAENYIKNPSPYFFSTHSLESMLKISNDYNK